MTDSVRANHDRRPHGHRCDHSGSNLRRSCNSDGPLSARRERGPRLDCLSPPLRAEASSAGEKSDPYSSAEQTTPPPSRGESSDGKRVLRPVCLSPPSRAEASSAGENPTLLPALSNGHRRRRGENRRTERDCQDSTAFPRRRGQRPGRDAAERPAEGEALGATAGSFLEIFSIAD